MTTAIAATPEIAPTAMPALAPPESLWDEEVPGEVLPVDEDEDDGLDEDFVEDGLPPYGQ